MNKLFPLLITGILFSQINVVTQRINNIQDALFMERKGELEKAKIIYENLLNKNPKNRQAYQRLKNILKRTEELSKAIKLIENWMCRTENPLFCCHIFKLFRSCPGLYHRSKIFACEFLHI